MGLESAATTRIPISNVAQPVAYLSGRADPLEECQVEDDEDQEDAEQQLPLWTAEIVHAGARVQLQHRAAAKGNTA